MPLSKELIERRLKGGLPVTRPDAPARGANDDTRDVDLSVLWAISDDHRFLEEAYRLILGRDPDPSGMDAYRRQLFLLVPREEIVASLIQSDEGRRRTRKYSDLRQAPSLPAGFLHRAARFISRSWRAGIWSIRWAKAHTASMPHRLGGGTSKEPAYSVRDLREDLHSLSTKSDEALWLLSEKLDRYYRELARQAEKNEPASDRIEALERSVMKAAEQHIRSHRLHRRSRDLHNKSHDLLQSELTSELNRLRAVVDDLREHAGAITQAFGELESQYRRIQHLQESQLTALTTLATRLKPPVFSTGNNLLVSEVEGFIVAVPADEWRVAAFHAFRGVQEPGLFRLLQSTLSPGMSFIDVGANVGLYTLLAARMTGESGSVISFEPTPGIFAILENNVRVNGFLERAGIALRPEAVLDRTGQAALTTFEANSGHNTLFGRPGLGQSLAVRTVALDDVVADGAKVDIVKIDAEGAEPWILAGMQRIIRQNPRLRIFMEFSAQHLTRADVTPSKFLSDIRDMGFEIRAIDELTGQIHPATDEELINAFSPILSLRRPAAESEA